MAHENYTLMLMLRHGTCTDYCQCVHRCLLFLIYKPFSEKAFRAQKFLTRTNLNWMCHVPGTDGFTSPPKDAVQGAPTHWV